MFTSVYFVPAFNPYNSPMPILSSSVEVAFEDYDAWHFKGDTRTAYQDACRFERLVERGYSPEVACHLAYNGDEPSKVTFETIFVPSLHDTLTDEVVDALPVDCPDMMFTDPLTPADYERLYALWLQDGDEIFHFDPELSALWDIPGMLSYFRALTQAEDERTGNYTHHHHLDPISY